jgi:hypothetical protein
MGFDELLEQVPYHYTVKFQVWHDNFTQNWRCDCYAWETYTGFNKPTVIGSEDSKTSRSEAVRLAVTSVIRQIEAKTKESAK